MNDKCFFNLPGQNKAMKYFAKKYQIPIINDPSFLPDFKTVFFSVTSFREFYPLAKLAKYKGSSEWIAGGNAVVNPTGLIRLMDYIFIGDCFFSFEDILRGERQLPGMLNCAYPHPMSYNEEKIFPEPFFDSEILLSKGCKRKCSYCVNSFRTTYREQDPKIIRRFIENYPKKYINLISNSFNDLSYFNDVFNWLKIYNKINRATSYAIFRLNPGMIGENNTTYNIYVGIEGFSERLRYGVKKNIKRKQLHNLFDMAVKYKQHFKLCYQFNLPGETEEDFKEFLEDLKIIENMGLFELVFIPNQISSFTPFQWEKPYYNMDMFQRLVELKKEHIKRKTKVFFPNPMGSIRWFKQTLCEWIPITEKVDLILKQFSRKNLDISVYIDALESANIPVAHIFSEKPFSFVFPWDNIQIKTSKEKLYSGNKPINIDGWTIGKSSGYYKAFKRIEGKIHGIHLGKVFNVDTAREKIKQMTCTGA